ncbi:DNA topoisomerase [Clostridium botulinum]
MLEEIKNNTYTNDSIDSFEDEIEAIRHKPASIGIENHNHLFTEVLANSIDESREGFGNIIEVTKHKNLYITVKDRGRGIPLGKNSKGEYVYKKTLCKLWSGGKMDNTKNKGKYLFSLGTNGCGLKATNFCSDVFQCTSFRDDKKYSIEYQKGRQQCELQEEKYNYSSTGTIITWKPSIDVFRTGNDTNSDFIRLMLKQQSIVNKGLKLTFKDETNDTYEEFYYENGIIDFIKEYGENKNLIDVIYWSTETEGKDEVENSKVDDIINKVNPQYKIKCNIGFTFNNSKQLTEFYHNGSYLVNGGTPDDFIKNAFVYSIDKYLNTNKIYDKKDKKIKYDDIKDSLIIISDTYSTISIYTDQAKKKIDSDLMKKHMSEYLKQQLEIYFVENPLEAKLICTTILNNARANFKANKAKQDIKKKLQGENKNPFGKIAGVKHCNFKKSKLEERILIITEGLSANSTVENAINSRIMGCMGLRGRFINSLKSNVSSVLENEPARRLIKALGCGIEIPYEERKKYKDIQTYTPENLKYGILGILVDSDAWGSSIFLGILTFMWKYMPTFLKENRVCLIKSPRYEFTLTKTEESIFAYNEEEKEEMIKKLDSENIKYIIGIKKGIGEFDKLIFHEYILSEKARKKTFITVNYDKLNEAIINDKFELFMGEIVAPRRKFIQKNIVDIDLNNMD